MFETDNLRIQIEFSRALLRCLRFIIYTCISCLSINGDLNHYTN